MQDNQFADDIHFSDDMQEKSSDAADLLSASLALSAENDVKTEAEEELAQESPPMPSFEAVSSGGLGEYQDSHSSSPTELFSGPLYSAVLGAQPSPLPEAEAGDSFLRLGAMPLGAFFTPFAARTDLLEKEFAYDAEIDGGSGNNVMTFLRSKDGGAAINGLAYSFGKGKDVLTVKGAGDGSDGIFRGRLDAGDGDNIVSVTANGSGVKGDPLEDEGGASFVLTGSGADKITISGAAAGVDYGTVSSGAGNDSITISGNSAALANSLVDSGAGNDSVVLNGAVTGSTIDAGAGKDSIYINGLVKNSEINGEDGNDAFFIGPGGCLGGGGVIDGGTGVDSLNLSGLAGDLSLDAVIAQGGKVRGVEVLDLAGGNANVLTVHAAELDRFNLEPLLDKSLSAGRADAALKLALLQNSALRIHGDAKDLVKLPETDGWAKVNTATVTYAGVLYDVYGSTGGDYLMVRQGLKVDAGVPDVTMILHVGDTPDQTVSMTADLLRGESAGTVIDPDFPLNGTNAQINAGKLTCSLENPVVGHKAAYAYQTIVGGEPQMRTATLSVVNNREYDLRGAWYKAEESGVYKLSGSGDNDVKINGEVEKGSTFSMGGGNDNLAINGDRAVSGSSIDLGNGNNQLVIQAVSTGLTANLLANGKIQAGSVKSGTGNDSITITCEADTTGQDGHVRTAVNKASITDRGGENNIFISGEIGLLNSTLSLGAGDDVFKVVARADLSESIPLDDNGSYVNHLDPKGIGMLNGALTISGGNNDISIIADNYAVASAGDAIFTGLDPVKDQRITDSSIIDKAGKPISITINGNGNNNLYFESASDVVSGAKITLGKGNDTLKAIAAATTSTGEAGKEDYVTATGCIVRDDASAMEDSILSITGGVNRIELLGSVHDGYGFHKSTGNIGGANTFIASGGDSALRKSTLNFTEQGNSIHLFGNDVLRASKINAKGNDSISLITNVYDPEQEMAVAGPLRTGDAITEKSSLTIGGGGNSISILAGANGISDGSSLTIKGKGQNVVDIEAAETAIAHSTVTLGDGKDSLTITSSATGEALTASTVNTGAGDDFVSIRGSVGAAFTQHFSIDPKTGVASDTQNGAGSKLNLGEGDDTLLLQADPDAPQADPDAYPYALYGSSIDGGAGNDSITINGGVAAIPYLKTTTSKGLQEDAALTAKVLGGAGNDTISISSLSGTQGPAVYGAVINAGEGDNKVELSGGAASFLTLKYQANSATGNSSKILTLHEAQIKAGTGKDDISVIGVENSEGEKIALRGALLDAGGGNDSLTIEGAVASFGYSKNINTTEINNLRTAASGTGALAQARILADAGNDTISLVGGAMNNSADLDRDDSYPGKSAAEGKVALYGALLDAGAGSDSISVDGALLSFGYWSKDTFNNSTGAAPTTLTRTYALAEAAVAGGAGNDNISIGSGLIRTGQQNETRDAMIWSNEENISLLGAKVDGGAGNDRIEILGGHATSLTYVSKQLFGNELNDSRPYASELLSGVSTTVGSKILGGDGNDLVIVHAGATFSSDFDATRFTGTATELKAAQTAATTLLNGGAGSDTLCLAGDVTLSAMFQEGSRVQGFEFVQVGKGSEAAALTIDDADALARFATLNLGTSAAGKGLSMVVTGEAANKLFLKNSDNLTWVIDEASGNLAAQSLKVGQQAYRIYKASGANGQVFAIAVKADGPMVEALSDSGLYATDRVDLNEHGQNAYNLPFMEAGAALIGTGTPASRLILKADGAFAEGAQDPFAAGGSFAGVEAYVDSPEERGVTGFSTLALNMKGGTADQLTMTPELLLRLGGATDGIILVDGDFQQAVRDGLDMSLFNDAEYVNLTAANTAPGARFEALAAHMGKILCMAQGQSLVINQDILNSLTISGLSSPRLNLGSGDDTVTVTDDYFTGFLDGGKGNDLFILDKRVSTNGVIKGGEGEDSLSLSARGDFSLKQCLSISARVKEVEVISLENRTDEAAANMLVNSRILQRFEPTPITQGQLAGKAIMRIKGDADDSITFDHTEAWQQTMSGSTPAVYAINGVSYHLWTCHTGVQVLVQTNMQTSGAFVGEELSLPWQALEDRSADHANQVLLLKAHPGEDNEPDCLDYADLLLGSGNDRVFGKENANESYIDLGDGHNILNIAGVVSGCEVNAGSGDDQVFVNAAESSDFDLGGGNNWLAVNGHFDGSLDTYNGDDYLDIYGNYCSTEYGGRVNLGEGNDEVYIDGSIYGYDAGGGKNSTWINLGSNGEKLLEMYGDLNAYCLISAGEFERSGDYAENPLAIAPTTEIVIHGSVLGGSISGAGGDDNIQIGGDVNLGNISMGSGGDDHLRINGSVTGSYIFNSYKGSINIDGDFTDSTMNMMPGEGPSTGIFIGGDVSGEGTSIQAVGALHIYGSLLGGQITMSGEDEINGDNVFLGGMKAGSIDAGGGDNNLYLSLDGQSDDIFGAQGAFSGAIDQTTGRSNILNFDRIDLDLKGGEEDELIITQESINNLMKMGSGDGLTPNGVKVFVYGDTENAMDAVNFANDVQLTYHEGSPEQLGDSMFFDHYTDDSGNDWYILQGMLTNASGG